MRIIFVIIILIILLDTLVITTIRRSKNITTIKVLYALLVLLFPIIGILLFYLISFLQNRNIRSTKVE